MVIVKLCYMYKGGHSQMMSNFKEGMEDTELILNLKNVMTKAEKGPDTIVKIVKTTIFCSLIRGRTQGGPMGSEPLSRKNFY